MMLPRIAVRTVFTSLAVYAGTVGFAQGPWKNFSAERSVPRAPSGMDGVATYARAQTNPINQAIIRDRQFDIPFHVMQAGVAPSEVRLYVSRDSGREWVIAARKSPNERQFSFLAPEDGLYYFATRTIDVSGKAHPGEESIAPELAVLVDTTEPQCQIQAEADDAGGVHLQFSVADGSLTTAAVQKPPQMQVMYVSDSQRERWIPITVPANQIMLDPSGLAHGKVRFSPPEPWRYLQIRVIATDPAGNQAVVDRQIERPRVASGVRAQLASMQQPATNRQEPPPQTAHDAGYSMSVSLPPQSTPEPGTTGGPAESKGNASERPTATKIAVSPTFPVAQTPVTVNPFAPPGTSSASVDYVPATHRPDATFYASSPAPTRGFPIPSPTASTVANRQSDRAIDQTNPPTGPRLGAPNQEMLTPNNLSPTSPLAAYAGANDASSATVTPEPATSPRSPASAMRPIEMETLPPPQGVRNDAAISGLAPEGANLLDERMVSMRPAMPTVPEDQIRDTRLKTFELAYEIDSMGAQGISAVELWGSRDGGMSWSNWGTDEDRESPFDIETSGEGLYGFRIVVVGRNGLTSEIPQPGEPADIYVRVDQSAPAVHLTAARYGQDHEAGSLIIEYSCRDENLASRPISLAFSGEANGPWTTIATGLENSGRYAWPADPRLPKQIYLRIEAIDRAGNVGVESTPKPIDVRGLAPSAKIRGFRSIDP